MKHVLRRLLHALQVARWCLVNFIGSKKFWVQQSTNQQERYFHFFVRLLPSDLIIAGNEPKVYMGWGWGWARGLQLPLLPCRVRANGVVDTFIYDCFKRLICLSVTLHWVVTCARTNCRLFIVCLNLQYYLLLLKSSWKETTFAVNLYSGCKTQFLLQLLMNLWFF